MIKNSFQDLTGRKVVLEQGNNDPLRQLVEHFHLFCEACDWLAHDGDEPKSLIWWLGILGLDDDTFVAAIKKHAYSIGTGGLGFLLAFAKRHDLTIDVSHLQAKLNSIQRYKNV